MHPIIALWSHPRSMSTATERIMRERGDLRCFHEPFMYDYYIERQVRVMPHFEPQDGHPVSYEAVRDMLLTEAEAQPVFIKDMSFYVMPHILKDEAWQGRLVNCFLVRDPVASIPSYFKLDPEVTLDEIGLEAQAEHHKALVAAGEKAVVVRAEGIRGDAKGVLSALWAEIGLTPADHAFDWQGAQPEDWKQVEGWHSDVTRSKGIRPITAEEVQAQKAKFEAMSREHPAMRRYLTHHQPHYEYLCSQALGA
ncbi:hypothetical protein NNA36_18790 [Shimia sp. CNT1-13L.2]|uniref:sulfotransferase-like domain-containing protein n=1 Tax=Shimia sp. CNT1-13L.2 TaxID=2959663 RepID=UPI0020CFB69D|nr:hypothetical protein [Shimia sp. CNT1-13L.2]MCP9484014.1 hypothetical protein [Shimia sp. CNT1-13L.2]